MDHRVTEFGSEISPERREEIGEEERVLEERVRFFFFHRRRRILLITTCFIRFY